MRTMAKQFARICKVFVQCTVYSIMILCRFSVPDLREGVNVMMCNQPKLRQELCYADVRIIINV